MWLQLPQKRKSKKPQMRFRRNSSTRCKWINLIFCHYQLLLIWIISKRRIWLKLMRKMFLHCWNKLKLKVNCRKPLCYLNNRIILTSYKIKNHKTNRYFWIPNKKTITTQKMINAIKYSNSKISNQINDQKA